MEAAQLVDILACQHELLSYETRLYVQTQIDHTTERDTQRQRQRVLDFLASAETHQAVLSPAELQQLRLSCSQMVDALDSYNRDQRDPPVAASQPVFSLVPTGGRPRKHIDVDWLSRAKRFRGPKGIAAHLPAVCPRTVRRRIIDSGLDVKRPPVMLHAPGTPMRRNPVSATRRPARPVDTATLDSHVASFLNTFPNHGRSMMEGQVLTTGLSLGLEFSRSDISRSMQRVTGVPGHFGRRPIAPRKYQVAGPGSLWHHDGQHGLIHWKLVTHAFVDGFSRHILGIRTSNNNRAQTVLALFLEIVDVFGYPSRVRGDHGVENLGVAAAQEAARGPNRGSYLWGPSTANTRIERMWVDVVVGYIGKWKTFFLDLEANHGLDRTDDAHIWLLHYLYLDAVNEDGMLWADGWNEHHFTHLPAYQHVRGSHLESPNELLFFGELHNGVRTLPAADLHLDDADLADFGAGDDHDDDPSTVRRIARHAPAPDTDNADANVNGDIAPEERNPNGWGRPRRMFEVRVPEPAAPFSDDTLSALAAHLNLTVDASAKSMPLRRLWWMTAYDFLATLYD